MSRHPAFLAERDPTPIPAPERVAHDRRSLADSWLRQMDQEASGAYVTELRARAAALVRR